MIRLILLGAAVLAGCVLLKAAHDKPGPLTVGGAVQAVRPGTQAAKRAVDSAGELAGKISRAADTGWTAAKDTAGMLNALQEQAKAGAAELAAERKRLEASRDEVATAREDAANLRGQLAAGAAQQTPERHGGQHAGSDDAATERLRVEGGHAPVMEPSARIATKAETRKAPRG